jgi:Flp pilus assembly protein TadG
MMPIFLGVVFGMIDYGWYFYQRFALSAAVRDGVRTGVGYNSTNVAGVVKPNDAWSIAMLRTQAVLKQSNVIQNSDTSVTIGPAEGSRYPTITTSTGKVLNVVTLTASYTFKPLIGFVPMPKAAMSYTMTMLLELEN